MIEGLTLGHPYAFRAGTALGTRYAAAATSASRLCLRTGLTKRYARNTFAHAAARARISIRIGDAGRAIDLIGYACFEGTLRAE
jgi:hypothetical protein